MPGNTLIDPVLAAQAAGLADAGYGASQIAPMVGLNRRSVSDIIRQHGRWGDIAADRPVFTRLRQAQQQILEASSRQIAAQALEQTETALPKASALQAATVFAIMVDKSRLLAGESTANVAVDVHLQGIDELASILGQALTSKPVDNSTNK